MTNTSVIEMAALYRPDVVETFRHAADKEVQRLAAEATELQQQVNDLTAQIRDKQQQIAQYRQVMSMVTSHEDLPSPPSCRSCGLPVVQGGDRTWKHTGRELTEHGERCDPKNKQSPVAEPAKGPVQAFGAWNDAISSERAGGHS